MHQLNCIQHLKTHAFDSFVPGVTNRNIADVVHKIIVNVLHD